jgi:hypothetical protein
MKLVVMSVFLSLPIQAEPAKIGKSAEIRCMAARTQASRLFADAIRHPSERDRAVKSESAARLAYEACMEQEVPLTLRSEAVVFYSRLFGDTDGAKKAALLDQALQEIERIEGPESKAAIPLIEELATAYAHVPAKRQEMFDLYERALAARKRVFGPISAEAALGVLHMGSLWISDDPKYRDLILAEAYYRHGIEIARNACGPYCETVITGLGMLQMLLKGQPGREAEVAELDREMERLGFEAERMEMKRAVPPKKK